MNFMQKQLTTYLDNFMSLIHVNKIFYIYLVLTSIYCLLFKYRNILFQDRAPPSTLLRKH